MPRPHPPTVACLVRNSVSHDARVLKEAEALVACGYDVVIVGVQDRKVSTPSEVRPSGLRIVRVPMPQALIARRYGRNAAVWGCAALAGAAALSASVLYWSAIGQAMRAPLVAFAEWASEHPWDLAPLLPASVAFFLALRSFRRFRAWMRSVRIKRRELASAMSGASERKSSGEAWPRRSLRSRIHAWLQWGARIQSGLRVHGKSKVIARLMLAELDRIQPAAVHCHDLPTLPVGAAWRRRNPAAKVVFDSHEIYDAVSQMPRLAAWMWRRMLTRHAADVDLFITINDSIAALLRERDPELPPAVIVRNATKLPEAELERDGRLRDAAGVEPGQRVLLYQGGYQSGRGLEQLLESACFLPDGWVLVMMGFGSMESHLRARAAEVDPDGAKIRFIPPAPHAELGSWTADADLGLIPYENTCLNHWFCSPNKLWEYPVAGVPMLVSPFPELRSVVERHGVGRCLPEPLDGPGLARVLGSIEEPELLAMRRNCRRYLESDHWGIYAERLRDAYRALVPLPAAASLPHPCTSSPSSELARSS
jgi:hypothetical protein